MLFPFRNGTSSAALSESTQGCGLTRVLSCLDMTLMWCWDVLFGPGLWCGKVFWSDRCAGLGLGEHNSVQLL